MESDAKYTRLDLALTNISKEDDEVRFLVVKVSRVEDGKRIGVTKIPLFVLSLVGKNTPDFVYSFIIKKLDMYSPESSKEDREFLKEIVLSLSKVIKEAAENENLDSYSGVIFESIGPKDQIVVSIK